MGIVGLKSRRLAVGSHTNLEPLGNHFALDAEPGRIRDLFTGTLNGPVQKRLDADGVLYAAGDQERARHQDVEALHRLVTSLQIIAHDALAVLDTELVDGLLGVELGVDGLLLGARSAFFLGFAQTSRAF